MDTSYPIEPNAPDGSINALSDDILYILFDMVICGSREDFCRSRQHPSATNIISTLLLVCRRWMFILLSSQFPWAYINSSSKGIIEMYLKRSGTNCELDVHLVDPDQEVIDVVTSHKERLGQLHIFLKHNMVYSCFDLFNSSAPSMKSLTLFIPRFRDFEQMWFTPALSSRALPNLRKLQLIGTSLSPNSGFTELTHLCIVGCSMDTSALLFVLQANQTLQELILDCKWSTPSVIPLSAVKLPNLRWVMLYYMQELLDYLEISTTFCLRLRCTSYTSLALRWSLANLKLRMKSSRLDGIVFDILSDSHMIHFSFENPRHVDFSSCFQALVEDHRALATVQELWLSDCHTPGSIEPWISVLDAMPSLRRLFVAPERCRFIMTSLNPDKAGHVVCPSLQELHLIYYAGTAASEMLINMAEQRDKHGFRLQKLEIHCVMMPEKVEIIQQHVVEISVITHTRPLPRLVSKMYIPPEFKMYRHDLWRELED